MNTMNTIPDSRQIAVITGAGQGMGRATALKLAAHGFHVLLVGRTLAKLESTAVEIHGMGFSASPHPLDVTISEQVAQFKRELERAAGRVDALVNCAGEAFIAPLEDTTDTDWDRLLAVNLKGPFLMARALLPLLRKSKNPSIINVVSKVALRGYQPVAAYTAAKTGLLGFTRALAAELSEHGIRVVAVCPGPVDTPMRWAATPDYDRQWVIDAETIAELVRHIVQLPAGATMGEILIQSVHYDF